MMVFTASTNTLLQSMAPDRLRGRVMSAYSMMFQGMSPFGALFAGLTAKSFGAPISVTLGGMTCVVGAVLFGITMSRVRGEMRDLIRQNGIAVSTPTPAEEPVMS